MNHGIRRQGNDSPFPEIPMDGTPFVKLFFRKGTIKIPAHYERGFENECDYRSSTVPPAAVTFA